MGQVAKQGNPESKATPASEPISVEALKTSLAKVQQEINTLERQERFGAPPDTPAQELQQRIKLLRMQAFSYRQHINTLENFASLQMIAKEAKARRLAWTGLGEKPPYSMILVDKMRAEHQASLMNLRSEEIRLQILASQVESTRESLATATANLRRAEETLETAKPVEVTVATWRRDLAALETQALGAFLESLRALSRTVDANVLELRNDVDFQLGKISEVEQSVVFRREDFQRLDAAIETRRSTLIKELEATSRDRERLARELELAVNADSAADRNRTELEAQLAAARKAAATAEADYAKTQNPERLIDKVNPFRGRTAKADLEKAQRLVADLENQLAGKRALAARTNREVQLAVERERNGIQAVEVLNTGLIALDMQKSFWNLRYAAQQDTNVDLRGKQSNFDDYRRLLKTLTPALDLLRTKLDMVMKQIAEKKSELRTISDSESLVFQKALLDLLAKRENGYLTALGEIEETRHLLLRWAEEEDVRSKHVKAGDQVQHLYVSTADWLKTLWNFEIFAVEDSIVVDGRTITGTRGVTVAKVVQAISIFVIGYLIVALLTKLLMHFAVRSGKLEETGARIARKWILAVFVVILMLIALDVVKIPLTAFAFLGGAIAIGAGFGMQTLLKNLISGVMLLMERPFKPRDIVEVGGIRGEVTDINVRSCTIRDVNGIETLVPNSTFLEQNVTNWTLSNRRVRYTLNIGVAYGSPVRQVADLLLEVAGRHKLVLHEPAPDVLFTDFGDNALLFALYVWLEVGPGCRSGNMILSDLRFMIDTSFAEHGIEIPFPQRDVHLDLNAPLPVRVVPEAMS
jgi:potassium-dependent mechanosensitive channel